jgi:hypothetical protein
VSLEPFQFFIGSWQGVGQGHSGSSEVARTYRLVLGDRYLQVESTSFYPPQEKNANGERHQEVGMISFDKARGLFVLRQFHGEGFVNQYHSEAVGPDRIVFVTEAIENIPDGWRARETYVIEGPESFVERFELAAPGKDFDLYSENRLTRV